MLREWKPLAEQGDADAQVNLDRVGKLIQSDEDGDHREDDLASVLSNEGQPWEATSKLMWLGRGVFWIGLVYIVGHAALTSYRANDFVMLVAKLIFFPITFLLYPWYVGLWWLLLLSLVGYWASTFLGGVVGSVDYLVLATTLPGSLRILCYP